MIFNNKIESVDTREIVYSKFINWDYFKNSTVMITGATGLIGFQTVLAILFANEAFQTNIKVVALVRNKVKAKKMFSRFLGNQLKIVVQDILEPIKYNKKIDFIIHTANTTSSKEMTVHPVETIDSIVLGTKNVLEFARKNKVKSIVYLSSMEVYGDIPLSQTKPLKEEDLGEIDIMKPRSSYPMGKRLAESLCSSYAKEYNIPVKIARLAQTIGAGVDYNDNRVFAQFARNIVEKQDIVLKTKGETTRSYIYITDCISALFKMLEIGVAGECYNIANPATTCSIKDMAQMLCDKHSDSKLRFEIDDNPNFYLKTLKYELDTEKFEKLSGWKAVVSIAEAFDRLIKNFYRNKIESYSPKRKISFLNKIFSILNENNFKIITVLGHEFKINRSKFIDNLMKSDICNNKIVFSNFRGGGYGCNPKYITEEILKRKLPYEIVWLVKDADKNKTFFPKEIRTVEFDSNEALKELATAKIWVDNQRKMFHIKKGLTKKAGQIYIQTWHGSLGIKKIGDDPSIPIEEKPWIFSGFIDAEMMDYAVSNSSFETGIYRYNFWGNGNILEYGHCRNDIFYKTADKKNNIRNKVCSSLGISSDKKILLYAPSYRDNYNTDCYNVDLKSIINTMDKKFNGEWVPVVRLHPSCTDSCSLFKASEKKCINATNYPDMQELLVAADVGITDYSSWMFDYMLSKKPVFIYATDIEEYNTERGFYYPLEDTPFPISKNNEELAKNIEDFNSEKYLKNVDKFLKDKGCIDDGHASERVVDLLETIVKN